jgi:hypothetical protein
MYQRTISQGNGKEYLNKFVFEPENYYAYLNEVGMERMFGLKEVL